MAILSVDDGQSFGTIVQVLKNVFNSTKTFTMSGCHQIKKNKLAVFFWLAEKRPESGWSSPNRNNRWINIPDCDEKSFTQIMLNKTENETYFPKDDHAVFMRKKDADGKYRFYFYGIFKRQDVDKNAGICVYKRIGTYLDTDEWKFVEAKI